MSNMLGVIIVIILILFLIILLGLYIYIHVYDWAALPSKSPYVFCHKNGKWLVLINTTGNYPLFGYDLVNKQFFFTYRITYELNYAFTYIYRWFGFWHVSKFFVTNHDFNDFIRIRKYYWSPLFHYINLEYHALTLYWGNFFSLPWSSLILPSQFYAYLFSLGLLLCSSLLVVYFSLDLFYISVVRVCVFGLFVLFVFVYYLFKLFKRPDFNFLLLCYETYIIIFKFLNLLPMFLTRLFCFYVNIMLFFYLTSYSNYSINIIGCYVCLYLLWVLCVFILSYFKYKVHTWFNTPVSLLFIPLPLFILNPLYIFFWWVRNLIYSFYVGQLQFFLSLISDYISMEVYIVYTSVVEDFIDGLDRFCAFNYYLQGKVSKGDVLTVPPYGRYLLSIYLKNERLVMFEVPLSYLNIAFSNMQRGALMTHDLVGYDQFNFKRAVNAQMLKSKFAAS